MQYIKCMVYRHGLFDNRVIDFSDRLTIVYGKNGSGKSLLARSMVDVLWGKFSERKLLGDEVWNSLYLDLFFSLSDSGYYRICNTSDKNYRIQYIQNNAEKVIYSESKSEGQDNRVQNHFYKDFEGRMLRDFLGRFDIVSFINSSFVPASSDIARDSFLDLPVLKRIILDENTGFYNQYLNMQRIFDTGMADDGGLPPEVARFEDKKRDLEKKIQIMDIRDSRHDKLRREKNTIQCEVDELNSSLNSLNSQKEILNKIIENLHKVEQLKEEFEDIKDEIQSEQQKIKSMADMKTELDAMFPQFSEIDITDSTNLDRLQEVFNDIRNLNEKIDNFYFRRELKARRLKRAAIAVSAGALAALATVLIKNGFHFFKDLYLLLGIIGLACMAYAAIGVGLMLIRRDRDLQKLEEEKKRFKERIMALMEKSKVVLEDYKLTEIYELLLQYFEDYVNYTERKKDLAMIKSSLKEEEYMVRIQKKLDELKKEEEIIKDEIHTSIDTLNIVDDIENETSKIEELIRNIGTEAGLIKEKIETKERILQQIDNEFLQASGNSGAMNALIEERNSADRILKKWKVNRNSMYFITRMMTRAVERSEEKQLRKLLDGTLEKFNHLTGNQYITKIDDAAVLQMITENRMSDEMTPPVVHALLLSLKFTLSDFIINGSTTIPLLIDEPFQFMDDERCNRFRDLVSYVSNKRQVIIFTHQSDKRNWGNFVEL
ncbi:MAG TPA: AAA family ATPase [Spirochaetota bacterium]|nr:AAA family ATPase [Spirochaetota bacterium]HPV40915.1 AAA family ATPase [Spirochaetota bacterium]